VPPPPPPDVLTSNYAVLALQVAIAKTIHADSSNENGNGMWWKGCCTVCLFCSTERMQVEMRNGGSVGLRIYGELE